MTNTQRLLPLLILLSTVLFSCEFGQAETAETRVGTSTFILVRHAEKASGEDPELLPKGVTRAKKLSNRLKTSKIAAVYSTNTRRTMATAQPTATEKDLKITPYAPGGTTAFAEQLKARHVGQTVLIVGHSNSIPDLANVLSGQKTLNHFDESDYGNIIRVTVPAKGKASMKKLRY